MRDTPPEPLSNSFPKLAVITAALALSVFGVVGCTPESDDDGEEDPSGSIDEELRGGTNGSACVRSPFNCRLREGSGQRVRRADGEETWAIDPAWLVARGFVDPATKAPVVPVMDGNGDEMGRTRKTKFVLNHGQTRHMKGRTYVYTISAGLGSGGWVPIDAFVHDASLRERVGEVNARGGNLKAMGCYEISTRFDKKLLEFKVVKGATDKDAMEPDDYLPTKRSNGKIYMNLAFSVPGFDLGGPAVDIFPAGTKFQRLDVPTWQSPDVPSIDAPLYSKPAGSDAYTRRAGEMKFVYGYIKSKTGAIRYGWAAWDGLDPAKGCPKD